MWDTVTVDKETDMSNVIQFPDRTTQAAVDAVREEVKAEFLADMFKATFAMELYGEELGMTDYDIDCLSHILNKYSDLWGDSLSD